MIINVLNMIFSKTIQELKKGCGKCFGKDSFNLKIICGMYGNKCPECQAQLTLAEKLSKEVEEVIRNWDVEPCCHGIMQDELIKELSEK